MSLKRAVTTCLIVAALPIGVCASPSDWVSSNVPLSSPFYAYIEKYDGLGYLKTMTIGAKPYTRMQMAKWLTEIQEESLKRSLPEYLAGMKAEMERELEPELNLLNGNKAKTTFSLKEVRLEAASYTGNLVRYSHAVRGEYQPLNVNNNGYRYEKHGNFIASAWFSGKLGDNMAVSVEPRISYNPDKQGEVSLTSGYIKTRINGTALQMGKDPVFWGHSETGSLILGNNMRPLTSIKISNLEPYTSHGLFRFLGEMSFTGLYSELEADRTRQNTKEVDKPSFVGIRGDFTPSRNVTFGLSFASMLGGQGKNLNRGDYWDWLLGVNADAGQDKWNTIAGMDFKVRLPQLGGTQLYGEIYGEDQANYMPSRPGERFGVYIPRLSRDGSWDMKLEYAHTTHWWYEHGLYTNGYIYKGNIIGDPMGHDATEYFVKVGNFLNKNTQISLNANHVILEQSSAIAQEVNAFWVKYQTRLREGLFAEGALGFARINNMDFIKGHDANNRFAGFTLRWLY